MDARDQIISNGKIEEPAQDRGVLLKGQVDICGRGALDLPLSTISNVITDDVKGCYYGAMQLPAKPKNFSWMKRS